MPSERPIPGSPSEWMLRARSALALARGPSPEGAVYEDLCFCAQQAAEKGIQAACRAHDVESR